MLTIDQLETANKGQLREAMREAGLGYTGLNNDGMKDALKAHLSAPVAEVVQPPEAVLVPGVIEGATAVDVLPVAETVQPVEPRELPAVPAPVLAKPTKVPQPEQHGIKRPKNGTICAQIWAWCDEQDALGVRPEAKVLRAALPGLDDTTKTVQFYRWRKFNGISGR